MRKSASNNCASMESSLLWQRNSRTLKDIVSEEFSVDDRSYLIKVQCAKAVCQCGLNNDEVMMLKPVREVSLVTSVWCKQNLSSSAAVKNTLSLSSNDKNNVNVVLTHFSSSWFEVLNENGHSIPHWNSVKEVVRHRPRAFLLRRDMRCLFARSRQGNGNFELNAESTGVLRSGTVLNFLEANRYHVSKGRNGTKVKQVPLVKCSDSGGHLVFLSLEDKCALSPVAGPGSISGVHTVSNLISGFHFPLRVRPVCGAPQSWLSCSDRYHLRLTGAGRTDLLFLAALNNPEKFFVLSTQMLRDHFFQVAESEQRQHLQMLERHTVRVTKFLQAYHPHEALRYLLRYIVEDPMSMPYVMNEEMANEENSCPKIVTCPRRSRPCVSSRDSSGFGSGEGRGSPEENLLMDEVEDIYYYVRTGHFPTHFHSFQQDSDTTLALINARTKQVEIIQPLERPATTQRSSSFDNLLSEKRRPIPPPLPPRLYDNGAEVLRQPTCCGMPRHDYLHMLQQQQQQQQQLQQLQPESELILRHNGTKCSQHGFESRRASIANASPMMQMSLTSVPLDNTLIFL